MVAVPVYTNKSRMCQTPNTARPTVSIIILNWNGAELLPRCLDSVTAQTFKDYEIIVVDNASTDSSADKAMHHWPQAQVMKLDRNIGFSAANNLGAQIAHGRWLVFLNNDAFPTHDWLENLVKAAKSHPSFSFFASHIIQANDTNIIDSTGDICHISGLSWHRDLNQPVEQAHLETDEVFSPCAAAALYDRDAFLQVGGFDKDYFSHHEDIDLGFRLRLQGLRCIYVPDAIVAHIGSASFGGEGESTIYQTHRNFVWTYFKDMPGYLFWKYLPAHILANLVFILHYTLRGQGKAILRAKLDALRGLPDVSRKRREIQRQRKVQPAEINHVLDHGLLSPYMLGTCVDKIRQLLKSLV